MNVATWFSWGEMRGEGERVKGDGYKWEAGIYYLGGWVVVSFGGLEGGMSWLLWTWVFRTFESTEV